VENQFSVRVKRDTQAHYQQKYGYSTRQISVHFDVLDVLGDNRASIQVTVNDRRGLITRYNGIVGYKDNKFYLNSNLI
jgi:hypothetical protein